MHALLIILCGRFLVAHILHLKKSCPPRSTVDLCQKVKQVGTDVRGGDAGKNCLKEKQRRRVR